MSDHSPKIADKIKTTDELFQKLLLFTLLISLGFHVIFAALPSIDLDVSHAMTFGTDHFPMAEGWIAPLTGGLLKLLMEAVSVFILFRTFWIITRGDIRGDVLRCWLYLSANILIAPVLIVSLFLKEYIGRARPANIKTFGGEQQFTPTWLTTNQCETNCSFTSGEASIAATLVIGVLVLSWPHIRYKALAVLGGILFFILVSGLRVVMGRHFVSDVITSGIISVLTALALYQPLRIGTARLALEPEKGKQKIVHFCRVRRKQIANFGRKGIERWRHWWGK